MPSLDEIAHRGPDVQHAHHTEWAVNVLRDAMNEGTLVPGAKLSEIHIAEILGISRNTLRQAFMILVSQNLVEQIPNRGVFVKEPDQEQISELFTVRLALESAAIELAKAQPHEELRAVVANAKQCRVDNDVSGMALANQEFHRGLVALAQSPRLNRMMSAALAEMRLLFFSMIDMPMFHARFIDSNEELLHLVEQGETMRAQQVLREYLESSQTYFAERIG